MPKLARAFQKIFAGGITPTGNIGVFGSLAAGFPAYSNNPETIQSLAAWESGWASATVGNQSPAFQDFNGYQYVATRQLAYLMQAGIPEWNAQTPYYIGSFCQVAGVIYRSKTDDNVNNAVGENANWGILLAPVATSGNYNDLTNKPTSQQARAWVNFNGNVPNGTNSVINSQFNVSSVQHVSLGVYQVNFTTPLSNANYAVMGMGAVTGVNFAAFISEDTNSGGSYSVKTTSAVRILCTGSNQAVRVDLFSGNIVIFGT